MISDELMEFGLDLWSLVFAFWFWYTVDMDGWILRSLLGFGR